MGNSLHSAIERVPRLRVAVVGDVMLDRFVHGRVDRISPEAPVPVVHVQSQEERLGGAANVAANVAALGAEVTLFGVIGPGEAGEALKDNLAAPAVHHELLEIEGRPTTLKTRILGGGQQIARIDRELCAPLDPADRRQLLSRLENLKDYDAVIVSDYSKGVVEEELMEVMRARRSRGGIVVVDPKQGNFELYRGCTCITPNAKEASEASHSVVDDDASAERVGEELRSRLGLEMILLTRGEDGMTVVRSEGATHLPTQTTEVFDVTGAGDTVIATFAVLFAAGAGAVLAAQAANLAAGLVIRELGTAVVDLETLELAYETAAEVTP